MNEGSANCIRPPRCLEIDGTSQMAIKWKNWSQQYKWFEIATQMDKKSEEIQIATFMSSLGADAIEVYNSFNIEGDVKLAVIKAKFEEHFAPKISTTFERFVFNKLNQTEGESFDQFFTKIKNQSKKCEFGDLSDSLLRDKIIIGIYSDSVREKLLAESDPTLDFTIKMCKTYEITSIQLAELHSKTTTGVDEIAFKKYSKEKSKLQNRGIENRSAVSNNEDKFECKRCGTTHGKRSCPAYKARCKSCNYRGHFAKMCTAKKLHELDNDSEAEIDINTLVINSIETVKDDADNWVEEIRINNIDIKAKLDTGAQCNVLPKYIVDKLSIKTVKSNTTRLIGFGNNKIDVIGEVEVNCQIRNNKTKLIFKVVNANVTPILGKKACESEKLVIRVQELKINSKVFDGLGCVKNYEYDIDLIDNPKFEIKPVRRVPLAIKDQVKVEIDNMVKMGVLTKTHDVTPVVSPMVVVRKEGKLRVCLDPTDVNKNILRRYHPLKTVEEIVSRIQNAKLFTILDCKKGFWQIKVSKRTEKYLTMGTPWGRYSYKRLPFGLASAPEVFQDIMSQVVGDIENVECSMDDILIYALNVEKLDYVTNQVMAKIEDVGLKLNKEKCIFGARKVKFLGHILSEQGISADPDKTAAIRRLKRPENITELQRLLGMATYLSKFVSNLSNLTEPLRNLLVKDTEWIWTKNHEKAFVKLKETFASTPVLKFYETSQDVNIQVDASMKSFGAALIQNGQPVAYASKALNKAQKNYPPIELEAAAIRWACMKFHEYVYGKKLIIECDHKPLEIIYKKPIQSAPFRLQRIMFDVKQYDPTIVYKKGTSQYLADILSRDCENGISEEEEELQVYVAIDFSDDAKKEMIEATRNDPELQELSKVTMTGWPESKWEVSELVKPYWNFREEIAFYNGIAFKGMKVLVPKAQIQKMVKIIHRGHFGIQKCLSRAREILFWHGMTEDITSYVEKCAICQSMQKSKAKEPIITKEIPNLPFEVVGTDLFHCHGKDYLIIVDSYSGFFEFKELNGTTSIEVIKHLKTCFATHGIPARLESDNGPQFSAAEFKKFVMEWSIKHTPSSPNHPQGNGLVERYVQIAKMMIKKCMKDKSCLYLALLNYRNTPTSSSLASPNQRLMSRATRTTIPVSQHYLKPKIATEVTDELIKIRQKQKFYADKGRQIAEPLNLGDIVRIKQSHRDWMAGIITGETNNPRSFIVSAENGRTYRRNSNHIKRSNEQCVIPKDIKRDIPHLVNSNQPMIPKVMENAGNSNNETPNIILENTDNNHIGESTSDTTSIGSSPNNSQAGSDVITTRSGRIVKPINKLNL